MKTSTSKAPAQAVLLQQKGKELELIFSKIDAFQLYVDRVEASVGKMEQRVDLVEKVGFWHTASPASMTTKERYL